MLTGAIFVFAVSVYHYKAEHFSESLNIISRLLNQLACLSDLMLLTLSIHRYALKADVHKFCKFAVQISLNFLFRIEGQIGVRKVIVSNTCMMP